MRRVNQPLGVRCTVCASAKRKCSLVEESKLSKASPTKSTLSLEPEEPVEEASPKDKKGKGVLSTLARSFKKRKGADRSPEATLSSKKSFVRPSSPSLSSYTPAVSSMGPPLSASPSYSSFDSLQSLSKRNYEAERLKVLLNASQENLRLQQDHFIERERKQQEAFDLERAIYESRINELEMQRRGGGSGASRRG
jgi:hypothetical protein